MNYLILILTIVAAIGSYTAYERHQAATAAVAALEAEQAAADKQLADAAMKAETEAANHILDMEAAYEVGQSEAKTITLTLMERGANDVAQYPVFANPVCVLPDDSLLVLNGARARVLPAADPGGTPAAVPAPATPAGRPAVDAVHNDVGGRSAGVGVHQPTAPTRSGGALPGPSLRSHPKPKPITP